MHSILQQSKIAAGVMTAAAVTVLSFTIPASAAASGDVTGDGVLDESDVRTLLRCMTELPGMVLSDAAYEMADMNGDGILTMNDAFTIMRIINSETAKN